MVVIPAVGLPLIVVFVQLLLITIASVWLKLFSMHPTTSCWGDALAVNPLSLVVKYAQLVLILPLFLVLPL